MTAKIRFFDLNFPKIAIKLGYEPRKNRFPQLMSLLPDYEFNKCVARYNGDYRIKEFTCKEHFLVLSFAQLTYKYSMRDIESCLMAFKWNATADELICFAYIRAMEDYFDVIYANEIAQLALQKNPNSLAVHLISGLIKAQGFLLNEWCYAATQFNSIEQNTLLTKDLRKEGEFIICEYMQSIGANCK